MRRRRAAALLPIGVLLLAKALNGVFFSLITPPFQSPDEPAHYLYAHHIAELGRFPDVRQCPTWTELETALRLLDTRGTAAQGRTGPLSARAAAPTLRELAASPERHERTDRPRKRYAYDYPPLYYVLAAGAERLVWRRSILVRLLAMRLVLGVLPLLTVLFAYLALVELTRDRLVSLAVAAVVAFQPMFSFISATVNNDNLLNAAMAAFFWLSIRALRRGPGLREAAGLGVAAGVAILAKPQGLLSLPLALLLLAAMLPDRRRWGQRGLVRMLRFAGVFAVVVAAIAGWWFLRNLHLYGSLQPPGLPATMSPSDEYASLSLLDYVRLAFRPRWTVWVFPSFWARLGWWDVTVRASLLLFLWRLCLLGFVAFLLVAIRSLFTAKGRRRWMVRAMALTMAFPLLLEAVYLKLYFDRVRRYAFFSFPGQGRYFFLVLVPIAAILVLGVLAVAPRRLRRHAAAAMALASVLLNLVVLFEYLVPRYYV